MVMKRNMMRKNLFQSIRKSFGRYIAIVAIIALGASMFVGLLMTKTDMVATGQVFTDEQNMFDLRLVSTYAWDKDTVDKVGRINGVVEAEGLTYLDVVVNDGGEEDRVYRFYTMPETINRVALRGGRMPQSADECLIGGFHQDDGILGTQITVSSSNTENTAEAMTYDTYTIVGYVATPLYMDMNKGTTSVGNGSLTGFVYVPSGGINVDYYTEIHVTIPGDWEIYSNAYNDAMEAAAQEIEPQLRGLAQGRLDRLKVEAEKEFRDGIEEFYDGLKEYKEGRQQAEMELRDAYRKLVDAGQEIVDNEAQIARGEKQIASAKATLKESEAELKEGKEQLESMKSMAYSVIDIAQFSLQSEYTSATEELNKVNAEIEALEAELAELDTEYGSQIAELSELNAYVSQLNTSISNLDSAISGAEAALKILQMFPYMNEEAITQLESSIVEMKSQRSAYESELSELEAIRDALQAELEIPLSRQQELEEELSQLKSKRDSLEASLEATESGLAELENGRAAIDEQFAESEKEIADGEAQIASAWSQIHQKEKQLKNGKTALEEGKAELEEAWQEFYDGKAEAQLKVLDAKVQLSDAKSELSEARETIDKMDQAEVYALDRTSNMGYLSLDSASDIVAGVSRVFPAFFLLIASLVCITTMTRMIEEERTEIGTLKALGYGNAAIIGKYMVYAGSGAVLGCGLGVLIGSAAFPIILWEAYKIMLYIQDAIVLRINWWLCGGVVLMYTVVILFVTWYCCRRILREEPAELIRPKAPDAGKKIFLEYLPIWEKFSFLNKVTIRNIFRYRQRLAMMMVGIGGCTALLLTGFGLRDTIVNVVDYQFEDVTVYDMSVYFSEGQTEAQQAAFVKEITHSVDNVMFYHQSSVELDYGDGVREIYMIAGDPKVTEFIDLHQGNEGIRMPNLNEVVLSVGVADAVGIHVGDVVTLRNSDMQTLTLTVSGIYDNYVYNYAILRPETLEAQWGEYPQLQMAFVQVAEGEDIYKLGADISDMDGVMNISVSEDLAFMVSNMMDALDLVVWVIVFCAGALAVIVLYNLTNININERIREIATIKVLGFNASETGAYVFKENLALTVMGTVLGLPLGYLFLVFVMSQIKIDFVWFQTRVAVLSYVLAAVMTLLSAVIVDFLFYFKLDKINMAEALKSVE